MNALLADLVPALGWALVDFLWQGAVVGVLAWAALALLRDARPQARYAVALLALAACVVLPLAHIVLALAPVDPVATGSIQALAAWRFDAGAAAAGTDWRATLQAHLPHLVTAWSLGAALLALRFALGLAWVGRLRHDGAMPGFDWQARLERLAAVVGLAQPPELRLVDGIDGPAVAGWWRPVVLVPSALLARMSPDLLEALLAHELAHVRRHDYLVNLLQGLVESLLFYHPVVWWLSNRVRIEREQIADDLALRAIPEPRRLALALQRLDQLQAESPLAFPHLAPAAHGGQLMNRIRRLIRPQRAGLHWKSGLPLLAVGALCAAVVAQATPSATPSAAPVAAQAVAPVAATPAVAPVAFAAPSASPSVPASVAPVAAVAPAPMVSPVAAVAPIAAIAALDGDASADDAATTKHRWSAERGQPYALVRDGRESMLLSGSTDDMAEVREARLHLRGDFLWFRRDGAGYVVQDPGLLADVRKAWAPADAIGAKLEALGDRMKPHAQRMEAYGKQMEGLAAVDRPQRERMQAVSERMQPLADQQRELGEQMRALCERMADARGEDEREALSRQMESLSARMAPLHAQMSKLGAQMSAESEGLRSAHEPMQRLGEKMRAEGEPMREIGEKMGVLGKEQERAARQADAKVQGVIERALREGKAERSDRLRGD